ncbi:hypothetical protein KAU11_11470 [Candidatus Babeliales bacterium]|nr:hypothetical protein [Candidatus Babeliales bacterium]
MEISKTEKNYHLLRDTCRTNIVYRNFQQILSEHALALIDLAIAYACDIKSDIMRQTEKLTELHLEWQAKITTPTDSLRWGKSARKAIRMFPYGVMKLTNAVFPGKGDEICTTKRIGDIINEVAIGIDMGSDFHSGWARMGGTHIKNLNVQYSWYGRMCVKMLAGLKRTGMNSDSFFAAAAYSMEAAICMGKTLDEVE